MATNDNIARLKKAGLKIKDPLSQKGKERLEALTKEEVDALVELIPKVTVARGPRLTYSDTIPQL